MDAQDNEHTSVSAPAFRLSTLNLEPIEACGTEDVIRHFDNNLYVKGEETSDLTVSVIEFSPLKIDPPEVRLLRLHPTNNVAEHVRCELETHPLANLPLFIAIKNARGYRKLQDAIEIDGQALIIPCALERFLRYLRSRINAPTLLWVRYACVVEFDPQEQKAYWTREFSDKMYDMASQVFDMHEINSRLIENGYFEKVNDSRYSSLEKDWEARPDELILPQICPVRLGTQPNNESPTVEHQYMPLDLVADEIRIICIMPAEDTAAPIVMHVAHCPINCEVTYIALSYRWGSDETQERIVLNGQYKSIRKNLAAAIRTLRMTNSVVPMWIDAISINQDDLAERGRQIRRMGEIYDYAATVYSYVGQRVEDAEPALEFIKELNKHPVVRFNDLGEFHFGDWDGSRYGENHIKPDRLIPLCVALYKFLTRQYFRRVWILQEVAWATNPTIVAGRGLSISFRSLDMAAYNLHDMLTRDPSLAGKVQAADRSLDQVDIEMLSFPRKVFYFRYLVSNGRGGGSLLIPNYTIKRRSPGYLETLILARDFEATDPRDHIFALWSLAQDTSGLNFTPNYTQTYQEVYADFTRAWIQQHGQLDILGAVELTPQTYEFYKDTPSWCANWNVPATASCLVRKDYIPTRFMSAIDDLSGKLYSADGDMHQNSFKPPLFFFEGTQLHCHGIIIDQIKVAFGDAPDIPAGTAPKSTWRFHYWTNKIQHMYQKYGWTTYDDPLRAAWAMFHGDSIAAWPPAAESGYGPNVCSPEEKYVCLPRVSRHVLAFADSYSRTEAWRVVNKVLRGRTPFISDNGYMGLAPAHILETDDYDQVTWSIAVLAGCSVPLVLRRRENGTYELIGSCFVQGWMDGEWMETTMGADSPMELWDAIRGGEKLVIC